MQRKKDKTYIVSAVAVPSLANRHKVTSSTFTSFHCLSVTVSVNSNFEPSACLSDLMQAIPTALAVSFRACRVAGLESILWERTSAPIKVTKASMMSEGISGIVRCDIGSGEDIVGFL